MSESTEWQEPPNEADQPEFALRLRFDDQSPSFCHGFEMGRLDARLRNHEDCDGNYHAVNENMVREIARLSGYDAVVKPLVCDGFAEDHFNEWIVVEFEQVAA